MRFHVVLLPLAAAALAACTAVPPTATAQVPATLQPAGEKLAMVVPATGVQIYECRTKADAAGQYDWAFVAPEADLFDKQGRRIGRHYAGPHWEALDGSKVVGAVKERADSPSPEAIPWLLLAARRTGPLGAFSDVTSIQRVNTVGGMPPRAGCTRANAGTQARVAYVTDYYFYTR